MLLSPIESLRKVVEETAGSMLSSLAALFLGDNRFESISKVQDIYPPVLILHGAKDKICSHRQSLNLMSRLG